LCRATFDAQNHGLEGVEAPDFRLLLQVALFLLVVVIPEDIAPLTLAADAGRADGGPSVDSNEDAIAGGAGCAGALEGNQEVADGVPSLIPIYLGNVDPDDLDVRPCS